MRTIQISHFEFLSNCRILKKVLCGTYDYIAQTRKYLMLPQMAHTTILHWHGKLLKIYCRRVFFWGGERFTFFQFSHFHFMTIFFLYIICNKQFYKVRCILHFHYFYQAWHITYLGILYITNKSNLRVWHQLVSEILRNQFWSIHWS